MIPNIRALYGIRSASATLVYMLQAAEYDPVQYLGWFWHTQDFSKVMYRRQLEMTRSTKILRTFLISGMILQILAGLLSVTLWYWQKFTVGGLLGLALILSYPVVWAHLVVLPVVTGHEAVIRPRQRKHIEESTGIFANHPAVKIAVAGSYGKTSMKELLKTVLSEGKRVAATPANKNVAISHAHFARGLTGHEEVLIVEYGEGRPGDIKKFAETTHPTYGIITGLAPAHLDKYKTLQAAGEDIFALADYLHGTHVFVNADSAAVKPFLKQSYETYENTGALGWKVTNIKVSLDGTSFILTRNKQKLTLKSGLLGRHNVGPLCLVAALGIELGLTPRQVEVGVGKTQPFEHRMQPYRLGSAWVIDDTYNGNLEGVRAGTKLLSELTTKRKVYVTPGLVDQGKETQSVHVKIGQYIAEARPDVVVLMKNSVTEFIKSGLSKAGYKGSLRVEDEPLQFYQNLNHHVAAGDLVMLQNDWTDNYR